MRGIDRAGARDDDVVQAECQRKPGQRRVVFTRSDYDEIWRGLIRHPDGKVPLAIPELLTELRAGD
jgi:hypothetical protein